ncbi:hypothetical protein OIV83_006060 [Microbotryomycetes sp. JL201]|nr:hypothetical protein OIV83_006060 [Microbotryomycetes sp. JL201]
MDNQSAAHAGLTKLLSASSHAVNHNNNPGAGPQDHSQTPPHVHAQVGQHQQQQAPPQQQQHHHPMQHAGGASQGAPMHTHHHHPLDAHHAGQQYGQYNQGPSYTYSFAQQAPHYARQPYGLPTQGPPQYSVYGRGPPPQQQQQQQQQQRQQSANGSPAPQYAQTGYASSQPHSPVGPYHHHPSAHHPAMQPTNGPSSYNSSRFAPYDQALARQQSQAPLGGDIGTSTINDLIGAAQPPMNLPSLSGYGRADVALPPPQPSSTTTGVMAHSNGGTSGNVTDDEGKHDWPRTNAMQAPASGKAKKQKSSGAGKPPAEKKFICPHASCGRAFARNFNLQSHIKSHMGVRDYACPECNKKFSRKHDCTRHCIAIHKYDKETGKKVIGGPTKSKQQDAEFVDNQPPPQAYGSHMPLPPNTLHA